MTGIHAAAGRHAPCGMRSGLVDFARTIRLLTAVVLLGAALLIVALVGQGAAGAREAALVPRGPAAGRNPDDILRASVWLERARAPDLTALAPGTGARDQDLVGALVDADEVLSWSAGPAPGAGWPGPGVAAGASRAPGSSHPRGPEGGATVPRLWHGWRPELAAWTVGSWNTPTRIADRVGAQATSLGEMTWWLAGTRYDNIRVDPSGPNIVRRDALVLAASANAYADAARTHERKQALAETRAAVDGAVNDLEKLSMLAATIASALRRDGAELRRTAAEMGRGVEQSRQAAGGYGAFAVSRYPPMSPTEIAETAASYAEPLELAMRTWAPDDAVDPGFTELAERVRAHANTAARWERWPWGSIYSASRIDKEQRKAAQRAIVALDRLVVAVDTVSHRRKAEGERLGLAAEGARQMVEEARRGAGEPPRPPDDKGAWLGEEAGPGAGPEAEAGAGPEAEAEAGPPRHAGGGTPHEGDAPAAGDDPGFGGEAVSLESEGARDAVRSQLDAPETGITETFGDPDTRGGGDDLASAGG